MISPNHPSVHGRTFVPTQEDQEKSQTLVDLLDSYRQEIDKFEGALADKFDEAYDLLLRKHRDYGPTNIASAPGGAINGLRVRMHDKLARINHLIDNGAEAENEPLRDSFLDLANYGLIGLMVLDGDWPGADRE